MRFAIGLCFTFALTFCLLGCAHSNAYANQRLAAAYSYNSQLDVVNWEYQKAVTQLDENYKNFTIDSVEPRVTSYQAIKEAYAMCDELSKAKKEDCVNRASNLWAKEVLAKYSYANVKEVLAEMDSGLETGTTVDSEELFRISHNRQLKTIYGNAINELDHLRDKAIRELNASRSDRMNEIDQAEQEENRAQAAAFANSLKAFNPPKENTTVCTTTENQFALQPTLTTECKQAN